MADPRAASPQTGAQGYEPSDASVRAVLWVAAALVAVVVVSAALLGGLLGRFEAARAPAPVSPLERVDLAPPSPRLEAHPIETLQKVRAHETALLQGYGWIDRDAGLAHIPIDRAMAILAERGWPTPATGDPTVLRHAPPFETPSPPIATRNRR